MTELRSSNFIDDRLVCDYVLVNANEIEIDLHHKNDMGRREELNYVAGDIVEIESINLTFQIEQIYKNITFENS